jgi:hypothetical protein
LGAGSLAAFRLGRRLQSSIRSRGADQRVVRRTGASRPFLPAATFLSPVWCTTAPRCLAPVTYHYFTGGAALPAATF